MKVQRISAIVEPIYEAAKAWRVHYGQFPKTATCQRHNALISAVDAVISAEQKEHSDG